MIYRALPAATGAAILPSGSWRAPQCAISGADVLDGRQIDNVEREIASATAGLPNTDYFLRSLRKANIAVDKIRIRISSPPGRFSIKYETRPLILVSTSGELTQWKPNDRQVFDVSAKANGEDVLMTFRSVDSKRATVYRLVCPTLQKRLRSRVHS